jgi:hypothetical protein
LQGRLLNTCLQPLSQQVALPAGAQRSFNVSLKHCKQQQQQQQQQ